MAGDERGQRLRTEIADWLAPFTQDSRARKLVLLSIGRLLLKRSDTWRQVAIDRETDIRHAADWVSASVVNGAAWLSNTDELGRPKKLLKFSTLDDMVKEADKAMRLASQSAGRPEVGPGHELPYAVLSDGFVVVRMMSQQSLDRESSIMQHCIGNGAYDGFLEGDGMLLLSLRDRNGNPHATISVDMKDREVLEIQGKQNTFPVERYMPHIREFLKTTGFSYSEAPAMFGMICDSGGAWHDLDTLPNAFVTAGSLDLRSVRPFRLPDDLVVNGAFVVGNWLDRLPDRLRVIRDFVTGDTYLPLPPELSVGGDMWVYADRVGKAKLPMRMDVGHLKVIAGNKAILPSKFEVSGDLTVYISAGQNVPDELKVGGHLDLSNVTLKKWPGKIDCGSLEIECRGPICLEGDIRVRGDFTARRGRFSFPAKMRVDGDAHMGLAGELEPIDNLPDYFAVGGSLDLERRTVHRMPIKLNVGEDLRLTDATVSGLECVTRLGGTLHIEGTALKEIPTSLKRIGGLNAARSALETLPDDLDCRGNLILIGVPMTELPGGLKVSGNFFAQDSGLVSIPRDAVIGGRIIGVRVPAHLHRPRGGRLPIPMSR